ncbi:MAG: ABC transporter permease [Chloroflexi bacterium]|nr:ABC transporter permease [Chloroflexota bacterium]
MSTLPRPHRRRPARRELLERWGLPILVFVLLIGLWQGGALHALLGLREFQLPFPLQIWEALLDRADILLWDAVVYTGFEAVAGLAIGASVGFLCAWLFVSYPWLRAGALPIAAAMNAVPIVAVAPIAVLWLGFAQPSKIAVVALMTFAPMVVNAYKGLSSVDSHSLDLLASVAASPWDVFVKLRLPASLPYVFSALKVGITLALIGAVVSEFFNAQRGLGITLSNNIQVARMPLAWAAIVVAALLGLLLYGLIGAVERLSIPWHVSFRRTR